MLLSSDKQSKAFELHQFGAPRAYTLRFGKPQETAMRASLGLRLRGSMSWQWVCIGTALPHFHIQNASGDGAGHQ